MRLSRSMSSTSFPLFPSPFLFLFSFPKTLNIPPLKEKKFQNEKWPQNARDEHHHAARDAFVLSSFGRTTFRHATPSFARVSPSRRLFESARRGIHVHRANVREAIFNASMRRARQKWWWWRRREKGSTRETKTKTRRDVWRRANDDSDEVLREVLRRVYAAVADG